MNRVPKPPAYLDPLTEIEGCYFFAVPKFFPLEHANTRWLLAAVRADNVDKVKRKIEIRPDLFRSGYYQLLDNPQLYNCRDPNSVPLFHKQAVLYLNAVGMAIYLRSAAILNLLFEYRDPSGEQVYNINDPQYATHVQDSVNGDFHSYPLPLVMIRGGFFESATQLLAAGWNPRDSICMPIRHRYERRAMYYHDWLDYTLCLMQDKPLLTLPKLVYYMICDHTLRKYKKTPMSVLLPGTEEDRIPTGILNVDDLPENAKMIGVRSLLDIAEDYSVYLQSKERCQMIQECITEMVSEGVNPEIMMAAAQDFDGYEAQSEVPSAVAKGNADVTGNPIFDSSNANNNAAADRSKRKKKAVDYSTLPYASEPTRILLFALRTGARKDCNVPLLLLLDSVAEYIRRNLFLINPLPTPQKGKKGRDNDKQSLEMRYALQKRDARNAIVLLLNLMQNQSDKMEELNRVLRDEKPKFKHLDVTKQVHNKRILIRRNIMRISDLLFQMLLQSREFLHFVNAEYPPYKYDKGGQVDFAPNSNLQLQFGSIQLEMMTEFNKSKTALRSLDMNDLIKAKRIPELVLNLRLGKKPTQKQMLESVKSQKSNVRPDSMNANNFTAVAERSGSNMACNSDDLVLANLLAGDSGHSMRDAIGQALSTGGRVTYVKVKRKLKPKKCEENESMPERSEEVSEAKYEAAEPHTGENLAFKLAEQIAELGRTVVDGPSVTLKLVEIYNLILNDLSRIPIVKEKLGSEALAGVEAPESESDGEALPETTEAADWELADERQDEDVTALKTRLRMRRGNRSNGSRRCQKKTRRYQKMKLIPDAAPGGTEFALDNL